MFAKQNLAMVFAAFALAAGAATPVHADKRLKSNEADWVGAVITCRVLQRIMENEMGYQIELVTMPTGPGVFEAVRNGDLDFGCESWPSYTTVEEKYLTEWGGDGSVAFLGNTGIVGESGYFVPRYVIEGDSARGIQASAPDLKIYNDLNRYKAVFKSLESGARGTLIGCPTIAWGCEDQKRLDLLGIDFIAQSVGSETAHWAELQAKYKRGEPFLAYAWKPHWIHAAIDLVQIELPAYSEDKWPATGWPQDITYNFGSPMLEKEHPEIAQLIKNQNLTNAHQAAMVYEIDINKRNLEEVVDEWMAKNRNVWQQWLP